MSDTSHPRCVPGAASATAQAEKFVNYLLDHSRDHGKAALFERIGFHAGNWEDLRQQLLEALPAVEGRASRTTPVGVNYEATVSITGPAGSAELLTVWAVTQADTHFVTAYRP